MKCYGVPCPVCDRDDKIEDNDKGWYWCYRCGQPFHDSTAIKEYKEEQEKKYMSNMIDGTIEPIKSRNLSEDITRFFDVRVGYYNTKEGSRKCAIYPYKDSTGSLFAQKIRTPDKDFPLLGETHRVNKTLWGSWLFPKGGRRLVITEGEYDAMSVAQANWDKYKKVYPVVSVPLGASKDKSKIMKVFSENIQYLNSFEEIILLFDMDQPGQNEAEQCVKMFQHGKCKIAQLPLKDASEMLVAGRGVDLLNAIWNAQPYRPKGILTVEEVFASMDEENERGLPYPWQSLTDWTYGLVKPSYNLWTAGTSVGKTTLLRAIIADILKNDSKAKIGILFMEETPKVTLAKLAGNVAGKVFDSNLIPVDVEERNKAIDTFKDRVFFNDINSLCDWEQVRDKIRHLVVGEGCEYIFLDHITKFIDGADDPNKVMGKINSYMSEMVMELNICVTAIAHTKKSHGVGFENGGSITLDDIKGDASAKQYAWVVVSAERDIQDTDTAKKNLTKITLLKCRNAGENAGKSFYVRYNPETGAVTEEWQEDLV